MRFHLYLKGLAFLLSVLMASLCHAQDFDHGKVSLEDVAQKGVPAYPGANAVILQEYGMLNFYKEYPYILQHQYHVKLKINRAAGFKYGDIKIPLHKFEDGNKEKVSYFRATVYSIDVDGSLKRTDRTVIDAFVNDVSKTQVLFSLALPNLTEGCIIEYTYVLETPNRYDLTPWIFQKDIPTLNSQYQLHMPEYPAYHVILKGDKRLTQNNKEDKTCTEHLAWKCTKFTYAMDSIAAFEPEEDMADADEYIPALYFNRVGYVYDRKKREAIVDSWSDIDKDLKTSPVFGKQLESGRSLSKKIKSLIPQHTDTLAQARAVYDHISKNIKWDMRSGVFSDDVDAVLEKQKGDSGDINFLLIASLRAYNITADPVLLTIKNSRTVDKELPTLKGFNYVVARTKVGNVTYYLDATDPTRPFGMLPEYCLHDKGRVIARTDSSYWVDMTTPFKDIVTNLLDVTLDGNAQIKGSAKIYSAGYRSASKRRQIKGYNNLDEYLESIGGNFKRIKILKATVNGLDSLDLPVSETYIIEVPSTIYNTKEQIRFNPFLLDHLDQNPFKSAKRKYPVDHGPPSEQRYSLTLHIPAGYEVVSFPRNTALAIPNKGGSFMTSYSQDDDKIAFSYLIQINKAIYTPAEYPFLRELFNKIIQCQQEEIVLKKKS